MYITANDGSSEKWWSLGRLKHSWFYHQGESVSGWWYSQSSCLLPKSSNAFPDISPPGVGLLKYLFIGRLSYSLSIRTLTMRGSSTKINYCSTQAKHGLSINIFHLATISRPSSLLYCWVLWVWSTKIYYSCSTDHNNSLNSLIPRPLLRGLGMRYNGVNLPIGYVFKHCREEKNKQSDYSSVT